MRYTEDTRVLSIICLSVVDDTHFADDRVSKYYSDNGKSSSNDLNHTISSVAIRSAQVGPASYFEVKHINCTININWDFGIKFEEKVMTQIKVLDAGFSTQLSTHVGDKIDGDPLWTARFLVTDSKAVFATHLDFLRAGADVILTNTYQASIDGFVKYLNMTKEESLQIIRNAVDYAKDAVSAYINEIENNANIITNRKPLIAGSCGPYGACLHDGSEYTGSYCPDVSRQFLIDWHRPRIRTLIEKGVDLLAIETIPCVREAEAIIDLLKEFPDTHAWLTFSCRDDGKSIADGSNFQNIAVRCYKNALPGQLLAIGVNCIAPQYVTTLLKGINRNSSDDFIPLVVYPNSGEKYLVSEGWKKEGEAPSLHEFIDEWLDLGVCYIGGCCRTYATDIKKIRSKVDQRQAQLIDM